MNSNREAVIHIRVPADQKGRWVRASRAEGKKLSDWIVERVEMEPDTAERKAPWLPDGGADD